MKIIASGTMAGRSAGTWYALETARRLAARGHNVWYLPRPNGDARDRAVAAGLRLVDGIDLEEKSPRNMYRNLRALLSAIATIGPDAILAHGPEDHALWGLAKALRAPKLAVIRIRALDPKPPKRHPLSAWLHRRATDMIVTANSRHYASYQQRLRIPHEKLRIIEAGIDPVDFDDQSDTAFRANNVDLPLGKKVAVMVGRFAPVKGHRVLLSAAGRIARRRADVHFLWVGYPEAYSAELLQRWIVEANLVGQITVVDRMLPHLSALLARCHVGVVASIGSETVSRSLLEYMACGLPVVATDIGGIPDLMRRGEFGRLVRADDPAALADALVDVLENDDRRALFGRNAREYVLNNCTWNQRVDEWEDVLYQTVSRVRGESIPRLMDADG